MTIYALLREFLLVEDRLGPLESLQRTRMADWATTRLSDPIPNKNLPINMGTNDGDAATINAPRVTHPE